MMDACLVAIAEHGLVPVRAGRAHDAGRRSRRVAGGDVGGASGDGQRRGGVSESAGRYLAEVIAKAEADGTDIETAAIAS
jgi:citrate synthase